MLTMFCQIVQNIKMYNMFIFDVIIFVSHVAEEWKNVVIYFHMKYLLLVNLKIAVLFSHTQSKYITIFCTNTHFLIL